jgi:ubiquinone/menaquinone biosynthesis C-methylase UbiE
MNKIEQAHKRYVHQATWTKDLRAHLISKISLPNNANILEIGSGTSAVLNEYRASHNLFALDVDFEALDYARSNVALQHSTQADAGRLPYPSNSFDFCYCHFLLLWVNHPKVVLSEMRRVVKPGTWIAIFAEPDHEARIDFPKSLEELGKLQSKSLSQKGADTQLGRQMASFFAGLSLENVELGILGMQRKLKDHTSHAEEQATWKRDINSLASSQEIANWENIENNSIERGERIVFIPTFFAIGQKI